MNRAWSKAANASRLAVEVIEANWEVGSPEDLITRCHDALQGTRGVAIGIAVVECETGRLTWSGVGNVEATVIHSGGGGASKYDLLTGMGGIVGWRLPRLMNTEVALSPGDVVVITTDGIGKGFEQDVVIWSPQDAAARVLDQYAVRSDDALVLVGRCMGGKNGSGHSVGVFR